MYNIDAFISQQYIIIIIIIIDCKHVIFHTLISQNA